MGHLEKLNVISPPTHTRTHRPLMICMHTLRLLAELNKNKKAKKRRRRRKMMMVKKLP